MYISQTKKCYLYWRGDPVEWGTKNAEFRCYTEDDGVTPNTTPPVDDKIVVYSSATDVPSVVYNDGPVLPYFAKVEKQYIYPTQTCPGKEPKGRPNECHVMAYPPLPAHLEL